MSTVRTRAEDRNRRQRGWPRRPISRRRGAVEAARFDTFGSRVCAWLIDSLVFSLPAWALLPDPGPDPELLAIVAPRLQYLDALAAGAYLGYFVCMHGWFGWTVGKRLMKIRVVSEDGGPISLGAAFIRRLPFYFELIWLDGIFALFTEKKQRAFDIVAKTLVVREPEDNPTIFHYLLCFAPWMVLLGFIFVCIAFRAMS